MMLNKIFNMAIVLLFLFSVTNSLYSKNNKSTNNNDQSIVSDKVIVKFKIQNSAQKYNSSALSSVMAKYSINKTRRTFASAKNEKIKQRLNLNNVFELTLNNGQDINQVVKELNARPDVEYAEPVYLCKEMDVPDDALYGSLQHLSQIKAPEAWDVSHGSSDVIIGIIDTGVDWDHEDLAAKIWTNTAEIDSNGIDDDNNGFIDDVHGWDWVDGVSGSGASDASPNEDGETPDNNPMDFNGHGTHVAGIAAAETNNGIGVASASYSAKIMPLRIGYRTNDGNGLGYSSWMANAFIYAADNGAKVTNLSFGNSGSLIVDAAKYAFQSGVFIAVAAGNENATDPSALGNQDFVMSVASVRSDDVKSYYSSYGDYVDISAPGGDFEEGPGILSTVVYPSSFYGGKKYVEFQGTSMASPLIASVAALVKGYNPSLTNIQVYDQLTKTADNINGKNSAYKGLLGSGRVNAYRALTEEVKSFPDLTIDSMKIIDIPVLGKQAGVVPGNGKLDPGENATITVYFTNKWNGASAVNANLSADNSWPIEIINGSVALDSIGSFLSEPNNKASVSFTVKASDNAYPTNAKLTLTLSNSDGYNQSFDLSVPISPSVLLVADYEGDKTALGNLHYYTDFFTRYNIPFDLAIKNPDDKLSLGLLQKYNAVVWSCEWTFPALDPQERILIASYLDGGGKLFISGQDIGWDLNDNSDGDIATNFYHTYLKADFISDAASSSSVVGVEGDNIGDGISFSVYLNNRGADQYPDEIAPLNGAQSILNYTSGTCAALKYDGDYKLVYFAFGGLESVVEDPAREKLAEKTLLWLFGIDFDHTPLKDTESFDPINVDVYSEASDAPISGLKLMWSLDSIPPFNTVDLTSAGNSIYNGEIPERLSETNIFYFIQTYLNDGSVISTQTYKIFNGADVVPPAITVLSLPYWNNINNNRASGFPFMISATDNTKLDPGSAKMKWQLNGGAVNSIDMSTEDNINFTCNLAYDNPLSIGDSISYYFEVKDSSSNFNVATSESFGYSIDTLEMVDGFENGTSKWNPGEWGLSTLKNSGNNSIDDSPSGNYQNNQNNILEYKYKFDIGAYTSAWLEYYVRYNIEEGKDTCYVEITHDDGTTWEVVDSYTGLQLPRFVKKIVILDKYIPYGEIGLRFRMKTDDSGVSTGINIDDIVVSVSNNIRTGIEKNIKEIPLTFSLKQNYPNPFNPRTSIEYQIAEKSKVTLSIFNILGQKVAEPISDVSYNPGKYRYEWQAVGSGGNMLATGVYIYQLKAVTGKGEIKTFTKKLVLIK